MDAAHDRHAIPVASRIGGFVYAIRNIVAEARKVEAAGRTVRYLNIGDPIIFGFSTPPHLVEAVERAIATATTATRRRSGSSRRARRSPRSAGARACRSIPTAS